MPREQGGGGGEKTIQAIADEALVRAQMPLWERLLHFCSAIATLAVFLVLSIGDMRRYLWRHIIRGNLRWLGQITCSPQFFYLKMRGYGTGDGTDYHFCRCPPGTFRMGSPVTEKGHQEDERQHMVTLSRVFWIGETPVTNKLWTEIMTPKGGLTKEPDKAKEEQPVTGKSWYECQVFVKKLNEILDDMRENKKERDISTQPKNDDRLTTWLFIRWKLSTMVHGPLKKLLLQWMALFPKTTGFPDGFKFALASEAQWEYACRTQWNTLWPPTAYCYGDKIEPDGKDMSECDAECAKREKENDPRCTPDNCNSKGCPDVYYQQCFSCPKVECLRKYAWFSENRKKDGGKHNVKGKTANRWHIYDMHGNVWEWVNDWYSDYPEDNVDRAVVDPTGPIIGELSKVTGEKVKERVWRGGSCRRSAFACRSARRQQREPIWEHPRLGFRIVLVHEDNPSNPEVMRLSSPPIRFYYGEDQKVEFDFRKCPAGAFRMGSPDSRDDEERHIVAFSQDFYIGETTVTRKQWKAVVGADAVNTPWKTSDRVNKDLKEEVDKDLLPATHVSWKECMEWIVSANKKIKNYLPKKYKDYRFALPTEAQWEYACRADEDREDFCYGKEKKGEKKGEKSGSKLDGYAVCKPPAEKSQEAAPSGPARVATKKGNNWLIFDMHGNVWEWCADKYAPYKTKDCEETSTLKMRRDPVGDTTELDKPCARVLRGGSFKSPPEDCRSAKRSSKEQTDQTETDDIGFRVVLVHKYSPFYITFRKNHLAAFEDQLSVGDMVKRAKGIVDELANAATAAQAEVDKLAKQEKDVVDKSVEVATVAEVEAEDSMLALTPDGE